MARGMKDAVRLAVKAGKDGFGAEWQGPTDLPKKDKKPVAFASLAVLLVLGSLAALAFLARVPAEQLAAAGTFLLASAVFLGVLCATLVIVPLAWAHARSRWHASDSAFSPRR
jgi:membrane protein YdbS with pleckstrin-like domain